MGHVAILTLLLAPLLLSGCVPPTRPPNVAIEDAHTGGNLVTFNAASTLLASGGWEGRVSLWQLPDGKLLRSWVAHEDSVEGIAFSDRDHHLVTTGYDASLAVWDLNGSLVRRMPLPSPATHMVLDERDKLLVTGHADGSVREWGYPGLSPVRVHLIHHGKIKAIAWHHGEQLLASSGEDNRVFLWKRGMTPSPLDTGNVEMWSLDFEPSGRHLMGGSWFKLYRWDTQSGALQVLRTDHGGIITGIHYKTDGSSLASISRQTDSAVNLLDPTDAHIQQRLQPHALCGGDIRYSPNGRYIATTSDDASVRIWDLSNPLPESVNY